MTLGMTPFIGTALQFVILFSGCKSQPVRGPHIEEGDEWLSWTPARREAFVKDFLTGYLFESNHPLPRSS